VIDISNEPMLLLFLIKEICDQLQILAHNCLDKQRISGIFLLVPLLPGERTCSSIQVWLGHKFVTLHRLLEHIVVLEVPLLLFAA